MACVGTRGELINEDGGAILSEEIAMDCLVTRGEAIGKDCMGVQGGKRVRAA